MKIMFLTSALPFGRRNGGEVCSARLIDELVRAGHDVQVLGRGRLPTGTPAHCVQLTSLGNLPPTFAELSPLQKALSLAIALATRKPWTAQRMGAGIGGSLRRELASAQDAELVIIDHLQVWTWLSPSMWSGPTVFVAHNVEPSVYAELAQSNSGFKGWTIRREARTLAKLDREIVGHARGIACLTERDAQYYAELAKRVSGSAAIGVLPSFAPMSDAPRRTASTGARRLGLIGTWTWESNRAGLFWFLREVVPHIDPSVDIAVAGTGLQPSELPSRVRALGFVESVASFYEDCDLIAIPTVAGSGIQEKTVEAIGRAMPIIATPLAVRGIEPLPAHVHVVNGAEPFARACSEWVLPLPAACWLEARRWNESRAARYRETLASLLDTGKVSSDP